MNSMADKKAAKREKMMNMPSYRLMVGTAKYMDKWFLDPLTSSSCHPKALVKEFSYFLMPCHQHCLGVNLLVQR